MEAKEIGERIKFYRNQRGITQMGLAERIGVSYQQIQKYEKDKSQITIQRLFLIAKALDTPVHTLLTEHAPPHFSEKTGAYMPEEPVARGASKEERILLELFVRIKSPQLKRSILQLVEGIVEQQLKR